MNTELPPETKEKQKTIDQLLDDEYVLVHVNSCEEGVALPEHLMKSSFVTLKLSRLFRGGIELEGEQIATDLLFGDRYFSCLIPYRAIWGATTAKGNNIIWPESTPEAVLKQIMKQSKQTEKAAAKSEPAELPQPKQSKSPAAAKKKTSRDKPTNRSHLKRVK